MADSIVFNTTEDTFTIIKNGKTLGTWDKIPEAEIDTNEWSFEVDDNSLTLNLVDPYLGEVILPSHTVTVDSVDKSALSMRALWTLLRTEVLFAATGGSEPTEGTVFTRVTEIEFTATEDGFTVESPETGVDTYGDSPLATAQIVGSDLVVVVNSVIGYIFDIDVPTTVNSVLFSGTLTELKTLLASDVFPAPAASTNYKIYRATLTQSGTDAPVAVVHENTIGEIVWSRTVAGVYRGTLADAFTIGKTFIPGFGDFQGNGYAVKPVMNINTDIVISGWIAFYPHPTNNDYVKMEVFDALNSMAYADLSTLTGPDLYSGLFIEIYIYN